MKPSETETTSPLDVTGSGRTLSRRERAYRVYDGYLRAPFKIIWTDGRARIGFLIVLAYVLMGTVGVLVIPKPTPDGPQLLGPFKSLKYPLGTGALGQGVFASIVYATPAMFKMIIGGGVFATVVATVVGTFSGHKGGNTDQVLMTVTDIFMSVPPIPLILVIAAILAPSNPFIVGVVLTINRWAGLARQVRSQVLTLRTSSYIEASRTMGLPTHSILVRDILPNIMPFVSIRFVGIARAIIFSSVMLYFLGVLPFSTFNWGVMMNLAYNKSGALYLWSAAHWLFFPMLALILFALGFMLLAQGADRIFNPRTRARHAATVPSVEEEE